MLAAPQPTSWVTADAYAALNSPGKLPTSEQQEVSEAPAALAKKTGTAEGASFFLPRSLVRTSALMHLTVSAFLPAPAKLPVRGSAHQASPVSWPSLEPPAAVAAVAALWRRLRC